MTENELFLLRDEKGPILYAPLVRFSARVNDACVEAVLRKLNGQEPHPEDRAITEYLASFNIFDKVKLPKREILPPTEVTLFPTDGCNLRCIYCYADCDKEKHPMPPQTGRAAIDYVIRNAQEQNRGPVIVKFHGNGEPFTAFALVKELGAYAKAQAKEKDVPVSLIVVSNGVWNEEMLAWAIDEVDQIAISFDGTRDVQNAQRPTASGAGSFSAVDSTLRALNRHKKNFGIKVTVTAQSVGRITDMAEHIARAYPECTWVQFEPVWNVGRYADAPDADRFYEEFVEGFIRADQEYGSMIPLVYATSTIDKVCLSHCGVSADAFIVTSRGLVTSCYEVYDESDPRSAVFVYGRYDETSGSFCFDREKMEALRQYTVDRIPYCRNCFCKYHCGGDCPAKLLSTNPVDSFHGSDRCEITRAVTKYLIGKQLQ